MLATVTLDFDPTVRFLGTSVRLETLALAAVVLVALVVAGIGAGRMPAGKDGKHLRRDDLLLISLGAIPGAVVGGRVGYVLIHLDYYRDNSNAITDPTSGSSELTLALVLGTIAGIAVARLLDAPVARWLHVATVPVLLVLGLGKLATVLGGGGQGAFADTIFSTRYINFGPSESALANRPAIASQIIEGVLVLGVVAVVLLAPTIARIRIRRWRKLVRPGLAPAPQRRLFTGARRFLVGVALWSVVRFVAAATWRDANALGQLHAEQLILAALFAACLLCIGVTAAVDIRRDRLGRRTAAPNGAPEPEAAGQ